MQTMVTTHLQPKDEFTLPKIAPVTNEDIITYLRRSHKIAEIAVLAERDVNVLAICKQMKITISEEELQAAGDWFRIHNQLLGSAETLNWLSEQRITVDDWSDGLKVALLSKKLKEYLLGNVVDAHYLNNRHDYRRVALSQIVVQNLPHALKIIQMLQEQNASFCALALEYSQGKSSQVNGGFTGIHFLIQLMPEIRQAIANVEEGEIVGPLQTKIGYHILKVEKLFQGELNELVREEILESLFQGWLKKINQQMN